MCRARREHNPLADHRATSRIDTVDHRDRGDVRPLRRQTPACGGMKLLVATGGNHKDVVRPIGAPECHHLVDRGVDARRDARQQAVGGRATKAEQPHRAVVGDPQRDKPIGWRDHLCRCCRSIAHRITRQGRRANQLRNKQTGQQDPRAKRRATSRSVTAGVVDRPRRVHRHHPHRNTVGGGMNHKTITDVDACV